MVVRRGTYPQVEPRAAGLMTRAIAVVPRTLGVEAAARVACKRRVRLVLARLGSGWGGATPETLERARTLGLETAPLDALLWGAPAVDADTPEVTVRRRLGPDTPFVAVVRGGRPVGGLLRGSGSGGLPPRPAPGVLARIPGSADVLETAGRLGAGSGWRVALVGGVVRDLLGGRPLTTPRDLDLAVEGDAPALARRLAAALGGQLHPHEAFLTATVTLPDGRGVDVVTARTERYRKPGALPVVEPGTLEDDLARRDFSVNALALRLDGPGRGQVLDPTGGLADLAGRRIRVLHPLSFVEDPTRIFRAARFAARLGFRLASTTRRLLAAATRLDVYGALSADRLRAELDAILAEPTPAAVLATLGRLGAFRLPLDRYRFPPDGEARLVRVAACARELSLVAGPRALLHLLALGARLSAEDLETWLARWAVPPRQRGAVARARQDAPALTQALGRAADLDAAIGEAIVGVSELATVPELTAAWACVVARRAGVRRYVVDYLRRWRAVPPLLTGEDLKALGLEPGPVFGRLLAAVRRGQIAGRLVSREAAMAWIREALERGETGIRGATNGSNPERKGG